ncbi:hypothetical protein K458DRAFT_186123 [Lentithecium fluviatile CBS 122367]|uniref:F-box domain-containing protein n=1 Tax=Lentithecium fluviatile CBS 122367 TaxID=1168545 RepID=A0A6G1J9D1_9PLEO|nr:hypothetical protein K458DRAFT_186123 [Lentithecium fluviatile CBS 122367]
MRPEDIELDMCFSGTIHDNTDIFPQPPHHHTLPPNMPSLFEVLPAELISQILYHLDPSSFYVCLQTSRQFREHALASTKLLLAQLARVPGERVFDQAQFIGSEHTLLLLFSKRAAKHLFNGAEQMADVHVWHAPPSMDRKVSCIVRWKDESRQAQTLKDEQTPLKNVVDNTLLFLEAQSSAGTVNICSIQDGGLTIKYVISPYMVSQYLPAYDEKGTAEYKVLKIAAETKHPRWETVSPRLAVLYAPKHVSDDNSHIGMKILCFRLDSQHGPMVTNIHHITAQKNSSVVAMALGSSNEPVIIYRVPDPNLSPAYEVVTYRNIFDELTLKRHTVAMTQNVGPAPTEPVGAIAIQGKDIHLYPTAVPMPYWTQTSNTFNRTSGIIYRFERRETYLPDVVEAFPKQSLGRVIACHHHHQVEDKSLNDGERTCVNTALELMIARDDRDLPFGLRTRSGTFLLKALHYLDQDHCTKFDMDADYPTLQHVFVAQLVGLNLSNLSSIGIKLAISPRAHRIAIVNWRTLLVYAVDPRAFLDPNYSLAGDEGVPGDYAFIEGCGWQFYQNGEFERDCVMLEPVELECKGVVFGLEWRTEDELWGWTEEGVVRWNVGVGATGKRGEMDRRVMQSVRQETWSHLPS